MQSAVETHSQIIKANALSFAQRILPSPTQLPPVILDVKNGMHKGSVLELDDPSFSIGPTSETDVMLLDDEVLGGSAVIAMAGSLFGPLITVTTDRPDVRVGGAKINPGRVSAPHVLPCTIDINGICFELRVAQRQQPRFSVLNERSLVPLLLTVATAAFGTQVYLSSRPPPALAFDIPEPVQQPASVTKLVTSENLVRDMIVEAGLNDRLDVVQTGSDMLVISGDLPPDMMAQWRRIRGDVDRAAGGVAIISNVNAAMGLSEMPPIAAVTLGAQPVVHLASGQTLRIGDPINGGWQISAIDVDGIEITQGNDVLTVTF